MKYIPLSEAASVLKKGESTLRQYAATGMIPGAVKLNERTWMVPRRYAYGFGRGTEEERAEPRIISTDNERDIVLAINSDERYGVYIDDEWHSAGEALEILAYLQEYQQWLYDGRESNRRKELAVLNIANIPQDQRCSNKAWECIKEMSERGEATLHYGNGVYQVSFHAPDSNETIPLRELEYSGQIGLYDKRQFPRLGN